MDRAWRVGLLLMAAGLWGCDGCVSGEYEEDAGTTHAGSSSSSSTGGASSSEAASSSAQTSSSAQPSSSSAGSNSSSQMLTPCESYCASIQSACTGEHTQYPSTEACMEACALMPAGMMEDQSGNSLACRSYHATAAASSASVHCPHAGPFGGSVCGTACEHHCDVVQTACTGSDALYADRAACLAACAALPQDGSPTASVGDTVQCRTYHALLGLLLDAPSARCPNASANSETCADFVVVPVPVDATNGHDTASSSNLIRVQVPAAALSASTILSVSRVTLPPDPPESLTLASSAFRVRLSGNVTLSQPLIVEIPVSPTPTHPQLAEVYKLENDTYVPLPTFYRASDATVITLLNAPDVTLAAAIRTLQQETDTAAVMRGRDLFLDETFGNEAFFGGVLALQDALATVSPSAAVALGVQVDSARVPQAVLDALTTADPMGRETLLDDPATTAALLRGNAIVGVRAFYDDIDAMGSCPGPDSRSACPTSVGITCALCHVTVTPTPFELTAGATPLPIGALRLDGAPNAGMNAGAILALSSYVQTNMLADTLNGWGAGRFDVRALPDNPLDDMVDNPTDTPPLWNFKDLDAQGYAYGWDGQFSDATEPHDALASHAEAVYDLVMQANGAFGTASSTVPLQLAEAPSQALVDTLATAESAEMGNDITPAQALQDVQAFERSMLSPAPGAFDEARAQTGFRLFSGKAHCVDCHSTPELSGPGHFVITEMAPQGALAAGIKVPPLRGVASTAPYFHDGSAADLAAVVARYVARGAPVQPLTASEQEALVEYLKSL